MKTGYCFPEVSRDFQRSFFIIRALRVYIREAMRGRRRRRIRRGLKSKGEASEEGRRNSDICKSISLVV